MTGCAGEEKDLFDQSAAERLNAASELYSKRLEAQPNGWAMQLYPTTDNESPYGSGYLVLLRFNADNSVYAAMNNSLSNNAFIDDTSAWQIVTDNGPVLSFNSWNDVIHTFSNPEDVGSTGTADAPNDETGTGIGGDYEYVIVDAPEDASYLMLKGKKRGTYNLLTPVEEGVDYEAYLADVKAFQNTMFPSGNPTFDVVHYGDSIYKMEGADDGIPNIYPYNSDAVLNEDFNPFLITKRGDDYYLRFRDSKEYNDVSVQEFKYLTDKDIFESTDNEAYYIDGDSPLRFFNQEIEEGGTKWIWRSNSSMSDAFSTIYTAVNDEFKKVNSRYSARSMRFLVKDGGLVLRIEYGTGNANADFNFSYTKEEDGFKLTYLEPATSGATNIMNRVPSIQTMLNALSGKMTVSAGTTKFNLSTIKLTSVSNPDLWVVVSRN